MVWYDIAVDACCLSFRWCAQFFGERANEERASARSREGDAWVTRGVREELTSEAGTSGSGCAGLRPETTAQQQYIIRITKRISE